ncbi:3D-(3,5/4)-trihydroxycyclohexane-1,2-dione acylhydrolase (decyclizing) [Bradyrhizobium guangdongense]|uniref:3D-(3,5/4)-trihydroxycyclohexane-1,2-dione acylhydrolase (decyclizing) n=1 Tax=Bradyrhizobium guangdongense TaxID=1325090 RepID=UPI00112CE34C|nr:3D-(3,5/4)-trihydroxycyclohexane-1,2-dione acylhydrolase (decyclizing) [Bradyrhizobium guangdongense]TPQ37285.1 3D-(3,5/4)-trihydroxycyclohexane-1,2-dione acylhydrolase (decyclizing) [Bradyrhizobium guangdongense]
MKRTRLTMSQALVKALAAQKAELGGREVPLFAGVWAIFGHGNVAGFGEALHAAKDTLPTFRAHNEQAMAHAAIAFAKASRRRRMMACTSSIGPGATNMVTAAALAHVNRLPVLFLPGDVFASRRPDPVLQQVEDFDDGTISANDCFRPVSRYFDRITRPEQIMPALTNALAVLTDPARCGPVTLALCQDVQAEAYDYPDSFFEPQVWRPRRTRPDHGELSAAAALLRAAKKPLVIAGGGVLYSEAEERLRRFCEKHGIPFAETQAGKSTLPATHPLSMGSIGVTGTAAANRAAGEADVILAIGTRLQDFTTGSWSLFPADCRIIALNVQAFDATKRGSQPLVADAREGLDALDDALREWQPPREWGVQAKAERESWLATASKYTALGNDSLPSDAQVIGAVQRTTQPSDVIVHAAGGLPGELHKLWLAGATGGYHAEYGYSTMGYEIAGGLGVKMADPAREVIVMLGDGSYLMLNSEIATSVMLGLKLTIVVLDNRGFGCIDRLQRSTGSPSFNNLLATVRHETLPAIDFAVHAGSLGAISGKVGNLGELEAALLKARQNDRTTVIVIDTDPSRSTDAGGHWWDVAVPEVSVRAEVRAARDRYLEGRSAQSDWN